MQKIPGTWKHAQGCGHSPLYSWWWVVLQYVWNFHSAFMICQMGKSFCTGLSLWIIASQQVQSFHLIISLFFTKTQWDEEKACDKCNWDTWLWGCGIWFTQHGVMNLTNPLQNRLIPAIFCITSWATSSDDTQVTERSLLGSEFGWYPSVFRNHGKTTP